MKALWTGVIVAATLVAACSGGGASNGTAVNCDPADAGGVCPSNTTCALADAPDAGALGLCYASVACGSVSCASGRCGQACDTQPCSGGVTCLK